MRIHIGHISPALAENIDELEKRLSRHGSLKSPILLHRKEFGDYFFAYVDMDMDEKQYRALSSALNGVTFKQSKLSIQEARPSYEERLKQEVQKPVLKYNPEQLKRQRSTPPSEINVFHARERTAPAPRDDITFRVMIKGKLHKPKPRKRKLWGMERRPLSKLVDHFADGEWRDSEGKAIEVVSALQDEHERDRRIAEDLAKESAYLTDSDFEEFQEQKTALAPVNYSDDEIETVPRSNTPLQIPRAELDSESEESDTEMKTAETTEATETPVTESLRSALSVERPFTLFGGPEDAVKPDSVDSTVTPSGTATAAAAAAPVLAAPKVGLFFDHKESPYLRSQTVAAKLVTDFDSKAWEASFWENRGQWNRALRRRRKDVAKLARKSSKWR